MKISVQIRNRYPSSFGNLSVKKLHLWGLREILAPRSCFKTSLKRKAKLKKKIEKKNKNPWETWCLIFFFFFTATCYTSEFFHLTMRFSFSFILKILQLFFYIYINNFHRNTVPANPETTGSSITSWSGFVRDMRKLIGTCSSPFMWSWEVFGWSNGKPK